MEIRKMTAEDFEKVLDVTVAAFLDTPLYEYMSEDRDVRAQFLRQMFTYRIKACLVHNLIDVAEENGEILGACTWIPVMPKPEAAEAQKEEQKPAAAGYDPFAGLPSYVKERWLPFASGMGANKDKSIQPPYFTLAPVVVHPAHQGKGVGSKLMRPMLAWLDEKCYPSELTTQRASTRDMYLHYGYEVTAEEPVGGSVISYTMVRQAKK